MKCPKCSGFMFVERYYDYFLRFEAWKCINCGSIVDNTILENKNKVTPKLSVNEVPELVAAE